MPDFKTMISDCDHESIHIEEQVFLNAGLPLELKQCKTEEQVIQQCKGANALINQYAPISQAVMEALPQLKLVVRYGVGVNNVDLAAATRLGVQVCNVPDYGMNEVADQAMALTLSLTRKLYLMNSLVHEGVWDYTKAIPIFRPAEQTVGIIGLGRIGKAYAKRAQAFGYRIIASDPYAKEIPEYVTMVSFEQLLREADVISAHCPSDDNIDLISEKELAQMKPTAFLVNVSRGGIINEAALEKAIAEKKIAGAGLDVACIEPMPKNHPLLRHENVLVTPHMAWYSEEAALELKRKAAEEAVRFAKGEAVHYPVNKL